jgi:hypothetical protein
LVQLSFAISLKDAARKMAALIFYRIEFSRLANTKVAFEISALVRGPSIRDRDNVALRQREEWVIGG